MKRKLLSVLLALVLVLSFGLVTAVPVAAVGPDEVWVDLNFARNIDGVLSPGEWGEPLFTKTDYGESVTVYAHASMDTLYLAFDSTDNLDERAVEDTGSGANDVLDWNIGLVGSDMTSAPWRYTLHTKAQSDTSWGGFFSAIDDDGTGKVYRGTWGDIYSDPHYASIPAGLEMVTSFATGNRITEFKIPMSLMFDETHGWDSPNAGDVLLLGGTIKAESDAWPDPNAWDAGHLWFPEGINHGIADTFATIEVQDRPSTPLDGRAFGIDAFVTIQDGIDNVAEGGTVNVEAGTYVEDVTLDKNVNIYGGSPKPTLKATGATTKKGALSFKGPLEGITIKDIIIEHDGPMIDVPLMDAAYLGPVFNDVEFIGMEFIQRGTWRSPNVGGKNPINFGWGYPSSVEGAGVLFKDCVMTNASGQDENGPFMTWQATGGGPTTFDNVTIDGNGNNTEINIYDGTNVTVTNSHTMDNTYFYLSGLTNLTVENNIFSGYGTFVNGVNGATIRNNVFENTRGLEFTAAWGPTQNYDVLVEGNTFQNIDGDAIKIHRYTDPSSSTPDSAFLDVHYNNFIDIGGFAVNNTFDTFTVGATLNWWGNPNGPGAAAFDAYPVGDAVSDYVDFNPWLPGTWETYFLAGEEIDTDGDGFSDLEEYWLGTDPNNPESYPGAAIEEVSNAFADDGGTGSTSTTNASIIADAAEGESASVNLAEYAGTPVPGESIFGAVGEYVDVHCDTPENLTEVIIRVNYDESSLTVPESSLRMYYWNSVVGDWGQCSDQGVETTENFIWASIRADTTPDLAYLAGGPFGGGNPVVELSSAWYKTGDPATVTIEDEAVAGSGRVLVNLASTLASHSTNIWADEDAENPGNFEGSFTLVNAVTGVNQLLVIDGDTVTATYAGVPNTAIVDDTLPVVTITEPLDGALLNNNTPTILATLEDADSDVDDSTIAMKVGTTDPPTTEIPEGDYSYDSGALSFTPGSEKVYESLADGTWYVTVDFDDVAGNPAQTASSSFTVNTEKSTVTVVLSPEEPYTAEETIIFTLTFDEDMNTAVEPTVTFGLSAEFDQHPVSGDWADGSLIQWVGTFVIDEAWSSDNDGEQTLSVSKAKDLAGNEMDADTAIKFTIDLNAPGAPTLTSPADEKIIEETAKPDFEWSKVDDVSGVTYQLQVDNDEDFSSPELDEAGIAGIDGTITYTPTEALANAEYSWRVRAIDGIGNIGEWSSVRTFTLNADTIDPEVTLISPNGDEVWQGGSVETISWTAEDNITLLDELNFILELSRGGAYDELIETRLTAGDRAITREDGVFSYTWTVPEYNNDHCRIKVTAVDLQANVAFDVSDGYFIITTPAAFEIELAAGWNLISLPVIPDDEDITVVINTDTLASGDPSNVLSVQYYDPTKPEGEEWLWYMPGLAESTLTTMKDGKGYWLYMSDIDTLTVSGSAMPGPGEIPPTYTVVEGWNLIGFKSTTAMVDEDYLLSLEGAFSVLWGYDAIEGYFNIYPLDERDGNMESGYGYWLWANQGGIIVPVAP